MYKYYYELCQRCHTRKKTITISSCCDEHHNEIIQGIVVFGWVNAETVSPLKICERRTCIVSVTGCINKEDGRKIDLAKYKKPVLLFLYGYDTNNVILEKLLKAVIMLNT